MSDVLATVFDKDGYDRTGDGTTAHEPGALIYVASRKNVHNAARDKIVAAANLEAVYDAAELVRQVYIYGGSDGSSLLAVVVPVRIALAEYGNSRALKVALARSLQHAAEVAELQPFEVPADILVETEPFSVENGLVSDTGKLVRARLNRLYRQRLEHLYSVIVAA